MKQKVRDNQRKRLYDAERAAWNCCYPVKKLTLQECKQLIEKAAKFTNGPIPRVSDGRGTRIARGSSWKINLPIWARTDWIVLHEYAHAITRDKHGPNFSKQYLLLIGRFIGKIEAQVLRLSFKQYHVKYRGKLEVVEK